MKYLWAPWRIKYIRSVKSKGCILCDLPAANKDRENYILYRGSKNFVMLNSYPYNPGHLLIAPFRHCANLEEFTKEERVEHYEIVARCIEVLKKDLKPAGFNMGANLGSVAGAGVEGHFLLTSCRAGTVILTSFLCLGTCASYRRRSPILTTLFMGSFKTVSFRQFLVDIHSSSPRQVC